MEAVPLEVCTWEGVEQGLTLKPPSQQGLVISLGLLPG